jgi:hypothetical protein
MALIAEELAKLLVNLKVAHGQISEGVVNVTIGASQISEGLKETEKLIKELEEEARKELLDGRKP